MTRILIAECKQEISSFNPVLSGYDDFAVLFGQAVLDHHRPLRDEVGGALSVFDQHDDLKLQASYSARAITSGGTLAANAFDRIAQEFTDAVHNLEVDACYFAMHGAMALVASYRRRSRSHLMIQCDFSQL